jgi:hypothetical protein
LKIFLSGISTFVSGGIIGGSGIIIPLSLATVVVIRKNVNNKKAISAIDAFGISGVGLAMLFIKSFADF